jgi:hypothetical protein
MRVAVGGWLGGQGRTWSDIPGALRKSVMIGMILQLVSRRERMAVKGIFDAQLTPRYLLCGPELGLNLLGLA